jgi:uncharacterized protein YbjQ (UPF0145 family)
MIIKSGLIYSWLGNALLISMITICAACVKTNPKDGGLYVPIPFAQIKYPTEMFFGEKEPTLPFQTIKEISIIEENSLGISQRVNNGRMLKRGKDEDEKTLLYAKLSLQAKELGADAVIKIKYKVFTTMTTDGIEITGVAVKYQNSKNP